MQNRRNKALILALGVMLAVVFLTQQPLYAVKVPDVPQQYQKFFVHYVESRSFFQRALNAIDFHYGDVGKSFALLAGISHYPNMGIIDQDLKPAQEDLKWLEQYLKDYEFFDEIVKLHNGDMTLPNLQFFLQTYFPERIKKYPKSRFLFAYSGHGMTEYPRGYILTSRARNLKDKRNAINLGIVRVFVDEVVRNGHHTLVLLNACYSGAFLKQTFGSAQRLIPKHPGAHAITAGGTGEKAYHLPNVGRGSVFFEKVRAALGGRADHSRDGIVTVTELYSYLKAQVQVSTDQDQNPQLGDLFLHRSQGEFFFLNRDRQIAQGVVPPFQKELATSFGAQADKALQIGKQQFRSGNYAEAFNAFNTAARQGSPEAMHHLAYLYYSGLGVETNLAEAERYFRKSATSGYVTAMNNLGVLYRKQYRNYAEALKWFRKGADAGNAAAMNSLGYMYTKGLGVPVDYETGVGWYQMAADMGYANAMYNLGIMYQKGRGVRADRNQAITWFTQAAELGFEPARKQLK